MKKLACSLAIGGNDPGGGAGLAADLRAMQAAGAFGCGVVAVVTVQTTRAMTRARPLGQAEVMAQVRAVAVAQRVRSVKTGALGSSENVKAVGRWLASRPDLPAVVDPVMRPTRGKGRLLEPSAVRAVQQWLIPRAALVTVNAYEAGVLIGRRVATLADARQAARMLCALGARAALVKGGHLRERALVDVLVLARGNKFLELRAPRLRLPPMHGTGCILGSLIAGRLAVDARSYEREAEAMIVDAVRWAKRVHHAALKKPVDVGGAMRVMVP
jgi:hydroxymethylpyrimidine/phosphomethylpyrimidine kinase